MTDERNNTKFTPEPWEVCGMTIYAKGSVYPVATVYTHYANAALIAQSPVFYADERKNVKFLGGLRDFFTSIVDDQTPPQKDDLDTAAKIWLDEIDRRMVEITELLARARGEDKE